MQRQAYLDALRGYAILGVVLVHARIWFDRPIPQEVSLFFYQGARGVQLFFVVSAFTLMQSWQVRHDGLFPFYVRRLFRIAPMFWLAAAFYYLTDPVSPSPSLLMSTISFLFVWHPDFILSSVPGGWSIGNEAAFYLIFPLLAFTIRNWWIALLSLTLSAIFALWANNWVESQSWSGNFPFIWFPYQLPVFLTGVLVFHLSERTRGKVPQTALNALIVISLLSLLWLPYAQLSDPMLVYAALFGAIAFCLSQHAGRWLVDMPLIGHLGRISYSVYFIHFALLPYITRSLDFVGLRQGVFGLAVTFVLALASSSFFATFTYRWIEQPGIRLGGLLLSRGRRRTQQENVLAPRSADDGHPLVNQRLISLTSD
jgi:exopolysaccharide production protein ExoZ